MTTSRADLLAGVDMEGGEGFCDSIYNFLKNQGKDINLFTNSGFGVWSQSDANKGLCTIAYDNGDKGAGAAPSVGDACVGANGATGKIISYTISSGAWADGDAEGVLTLGACTGSWTDNEVLTFAGVETAAVNGEAIGICNDPCNNDSTGDWTDPDAILSDNVGEYLVTTDANNEKAYLTGLTFEEGKIYKVEAQLKDGTATPTDVELVSLDGAVVEKASAPINTTGGFVTYSLTFEATAGTDGVGIRTPTSLGGNNIQMKYFICYEITPCCTEANNIAFDGWDKADITLDIYREHWGANTRDGSFYSLKVINSGAGDELAFPTAVHSLGEWYAQFQGRPVTIGAWVKTNTANHCRALIQDSVTSIYSSYHTGGGDWEWLEVTRVIDASASQVLMKFQFAVAGDVDGSTIVYISQDMAVFGWSLGEGMYQPRLQEMIWLEKNIPSNTYDNTANWSDIAAADLNIEADSDAMLPKGAKLIAVHCSINDSGSGGGLDVHLQLRKDATTDFFYCNSVAGKTNDVHGHKSGVQPCDVNGDVDIHIDATAGNTLDIDQFEYHGVQVT